MKRAELKGEVIYMFNHVVIFGAVKNVRVHGDRINWMRLSAVVEGRHQEEAKVSVVHESRLVDARHPLDPVLLPEDLARAKKGILH